MVRNAVSKNKVEKRSWHFQIEGLAEKVIFEPKEESESYGGRVLEAEGKEVQRP